MTVLLVEMNSHLLLPGKWYAAMRRRQLAHVNLFTQRQWDELLRRVGFSGVEFRPYLMADAYRLWDGMDAPEAPVSAGIA